MPPRVFADDPDVAVDPPENYEDIPRRETARRREEGKRIINRLRLAHRPGLSQGRRKPPLNLLFKKKEGRKRKQRLPQNKLSRRRSRIPLVGAQVLAMLIAVQSPFQ